MTVVHRILTALAMSMVVGVHTPAVQSGRTPPAPPRTRIEQPDRARVIVRLRAPMPDRATPSARGAQRSRAGDVLQRVMQGPAGRHVVRSRMLGALPVALMEIEREGIEALRASPDVDAIEMDVPERVSLAQSTALIQSSAANAAGFMGDGWNVAILDTGIERDHAFFGGRVVYEHCYSSTVVGVASSICPDGSDEQAGSGAATPCVGLTDCDHGTHVAGIAAGRDGSSGSDIFSGVAPAAGILAFQVFSRFESDIDCGVGLAPCLLSYPSDQILALERVFALRETYRIAAVNLSLGAGRYLSPGECDAAHGARKMVVDLLRTAGIATVVSSGNNAYSDSMTAPACLSSAVSVGATSDNAPAAVAGFSNSAPFLNLLAPGSMISSSVLNNTFGIKQGTSMAAPHVTGAWAVLKEKSPSASVAAVLRALEASGTPLSDANAARPGSSGIVKPLIRVASALSGLPGCTFSITPTSVNIGPANASGSIHVTAPLGCVWSAVSQSPFITIDSAANGEGSGAVSFTVSANSAATLRTGTVTVAGITFTVNQNGQPPDGTTTPGEVRRADFNSDGRSDLLLQDLSGGNLEVWMLNGTTVSATQPLSHRIADTNWRVVGTGDINGDDTPDIVWHHLTEGWLYVWFMNGVTRIGSDYLSVHREADLDWKVVAVADMNGDNRSDIVWQHATSGNLRVWQLQGTTVTATQPLNPSRVLDVQWQVAGAGDFNGDGHTDLLWRHTGHGEVGVWLMNGLTRVTYSTLNPGSVANQAWRIAAVIDADGDAHPDLVWQHVTEGWIALWFMNGTTRVANPSVAATVPVNWVIAGPK